MSHESLPPVPLLPNTWTQVDWFAPGPFPFGITRTYCASAFIGGSIGDFVDWRIITFPPQGGRFPLGECAQLTVVGTLYISVEMRSVTETLIYRA